MTEERKPRQYRKRAVRVTQNATNAIAQFIAIPVSVLAPEYALEPTEISALSNALYDAAASNEIIAAIINNLTGVGGVGELVAVTGAILVKRYALHVNKTREEPDKRLIGLAIASEVIIQGAATRQGGSDVDAGTTRAADRKHGQRKNDTGERIVETEELRDRIDDESGSDPMAGLDAGETGSPNRHSRGRRNALHVEASL